MFSSDALSSVAYAPQETLVVLLLGWRSRDVLVAAISIGVVVLLATVVTSYRQTIYAYPSAAAATSWRTTTWAKSRVVAAAALSVGYVLTVSVSIASAVDQLSPQCRRLVTSGWLSVWQPSHWSR